MKQNILPAQQNRSDTSNSKSSANPLQLLQQTATHNPLEAPSHPYPVQKKATMKKGDEAAKPYTKETLATAIKTMISQLGKAITAAATNPVKQLELTNLKGLLEPAIQALDPLEAILEWAASEDNTEEFNFIPVPNNYVAVLTDMKSKYVAAQETLFKKEVKELDRWNWASTIITAGKTIDSDDLINEIASLTTFESVLSKERRIALATPMKDEIQKALIAKWQKETAETPWASQEYDNLKTESKDEDEIAIFAENKKRWRNMHEGTLSTYEELPAEDEKDKNITHVDYTGEKSCVLQGITMAFEHAEDDVAAQKIHTALLKATPDQPWIAFRNYTSELVNPFLFQFLGFKEEASFTGKAINTIAGEGWYLISTAGHVEAILLDRRNGAAIYDPYQSNERARATTGGTKIVMAYKAPASKNSNYEDMLKAGTPRPERR